MGREKAVTRMRSYITAVWDSMDQGSGSDAAGVTRRSTTHPQRLFEIHILVYTGHYSLSSSSTLPLTCTDLETPELWSSLKASLDAETQSPFDSLQNRNTHNTYLRSKVIEDSRSPFTSILRDRLSYGALATVTAAGHLYKRARVPLILPLPSVPSSPLPSLRPSAPSSGRAAPLITNNRRPPIRAGSVRSRGLPAREVIRWRSCRRLDAAAAQLQKKWSETTQFLHGQTEVWVNEERVGNETGNGAEGEGGLN